MQTTAIIPEDPGLPGLEAIRSGGLAATLPELQLDGVPTELWLCGYTPGARATVEVRAGDRHFAVKAYAEDPSEEALLYRALADAGLASESGFRTPQLLGWNRDLRVIAISWLNGRPINQLIREGEGARAGTLAATSVRKIASLSLRMGPAFDPDGLLFEVGKWVSRMIVLDPPIGRAADKVAGHLLENLPEAGKRHLVHGTLYDRHILDLGDGPGVIDWQRFGQGPPEFDAGTCLAYMTRFALRNSRLANEVTKAQAAFQAATKRMLDPRSVAWYRAAFLLRQASRPFRSPRAERLFTSAEGASGLAMARSLITEAGRLAEAIA